MGFLIRSSSSLTLLILLLALGACSQPLALTSAEQQQLSSASVFKGAQDDKTAPVYGVNQPAEGNGDTTTIPVSLPTLNFCSNRMTSSVELAGGKNVTDSAGLNVFLAPVTSAGGNESNAPATTKVNSQGGNLLSGFKGQSIETIDPTKLISTVANPQTVRSDLRTHKLLNFSIKKDTPTGTYRLLVCDVGAQHCDESASVSGQNGSADIKVENGVATFLLSPRGEAATASAKLYVLYKKNLGEETGNGTGAPAPVVHGAADPECDRAVSPLVVDLSGQGISLGEKSMKFDINGDGKKDEFSCPIGGAFLALPHADASGKRGIRDINDLFGNNTVGPDGKKPENGFLALAKYDLNHDSVINKKDAVFSELRLWEDKNCNGVVDDGELSTLESQHILSIHVDSTAMLERDNYGNETRQRSLVNFLSESSRMIFDIWFHIR